MTYQRNIQCLKVERPALQDGLDDGIPDRVEQAEIRAGDHHEPQRHRRALADLSAVWPLNAAELGVRGPQEVRGTAEKALARMRRLVGVMRLGGRLGFPVAGLGLHRVARTSGGLLAGCTLGTLGT